MCAYWHYSLGKLKHIKNKFLQFYSVGFGWFDNAAISSYIGNLLFSNVVNQVLIMLSAGLRMAVKLRHHYVIMDKV